MRVKDIRQIFISKLANGVDTEIINACFIADEDTIFGTVSKNYAKEEHRWYLSQSLNINDMDNPPSIWKNICSSTGEINSNYGWCCFSHDNYDQVKNVITHLRKDSNTRRAIILYNRPSMHYEYSKNGKNDFICTTSVQYLIRDNNLITIVTMRSNDAVYGYKYDLLWQKYIQKFVANKLKKYYPNLKLGEIFWNVGSLHVYPTHAYLIKEKQNV